MAGGRVDGKGAVVSDATNASTLDTERMGWFGRSSTVNFVNQVQRILSDSDHSAKGSRTAQHSIENPVHHWRCPEEYTLPPRREADAMLSVFWSHLYPLYPFIDRQDFERAYDDLWSPAPSTSSAPCTTLYVDCSDSHDSQTDQAQLQRGDQIPEPRRFHVLLNVMFALGCHWDISVSGSNQAQRRELYWQRSKALLQRDFDIFNHPRLLFIQALLYMGVYLQSTTELTVACSNLVAVAIRMSESLGLHKSSPGGSRSSGQPDCYSLRWRTWAGCVMIEQ